MTKEMPGSESASPNDKLGTEIIFMYMITNFFSNFKWAGFSKYRRGREIRSFAVGEGEEWVLGSGNLTSSDLEHDLCVPIKVQEKKGTKKGTGSITTAKMKFLLSYNMKIIGRWGGGGYETLV